MTMQHMYNKSTTLEIKIKNRPIAIMSQNECDIIACISAFERGCNNVYLLNENGTYSGYAISRKSFHKLWESKGNAVVNVPGIEMQEYEELPYNDKISSQLIAYCNANEGLTEFPLVTCEGVIRSLVCLGSKDNKVDNNTCMPWEVWTNWHVPLTFLLNYKKIYISSLDDVNVRSFHRYYSTCLSLELLSADNINDALYGDDNLLIYSVDVYPESSNKINIKLLFNSINSQASKIVYNELYIEHSNIAFLEKTYVNDLARIIYLLDQGHQVINVISDTEVFCGIITADDVRNVFPCTNIAIQNNYIPFSVSEDKIKAKWFELFRQVGSEIPVVVNEKVWGLCIRGNHFAGRCLKYEKEIQPLYWNLISDEIILSFFSNYNNVLLSSTASDLKSLGDRLTECGISVCFFENTLINDFLNGCFDLLIYGSDVWNPKVIPSFDVRKVYANMLAEEIKSYLRKNRVAFYYIDIEKTPVSLDGRIEIVPVPTQPAIVVGGERVVYTVYTDSIAGDGFHTVGGRRVTVGNSAANKKTIHLFGPCTVAGSFTAKDEDTIASFLQSYINDANIQYNVVNNGNPGESSISALNRIMDTLIMTGDIVVLFGQDLYKDIPVFSAIQNSSFKDIFDSDKYCRGKVFFDLAPHLTPLGNKLLADYLFYFLYDDMQKSIDPVIVKTLAEGLKTNISCDDALKKYLASLKVNKVMSNKIGAIVMNCNPFTRGHLFLIREALKQVDFLYIFVVEEDSSAFSFQDRFEMVKLNCNCFSNVMVLPSGQYMISRITFSAYFNKEDLQNSTIVPAADVRLFGKYIAPYLGISKRFVGEEPLDKITRQYNMAMKEILPEYGIELVEIPRIEDDMHQPINATMVRKSILAGRLEQCHSYITEATYKYIEKNYDRLYQRLARFIRNG